MRRNVALIIIATLLGGAVGLAYALLRPTTYTSQTEMFASVSTSGDPYQMQMASNFILERIQTYVDMAGSRPVLEPVIDRLDLDVTPEELDSQVTAFSDPRTVLITVEATAATPQDAAELSDAVAESLVTVIDDVENQGDDGTGQIQRGSPTLRCRRAGGRPAAVDVRRTRTARRSRRRARHRAAADEPRRPPAGQGGPRTDHLGAGARRDPRRRTDRRGAPHQRHGPRQRSRGGVPAARTNLGFAQVDDTNPAVLITSAKAQEGKSSTSINLAISLAQAGSRVALVDVDLRQPTVADKLGLENSAGLTTALLGSADVSELLQPWGQDELYVLTAGMMPPNPAELLDSRAMGTLITRLSGEFDFVILDGPPLLSVADSLTLSKYVGRVLLVASVGEVRISELQEAAAESRCARRSGQPRPQPGAEVVGGDERLLPGVLEQVPGCAAAAPPRLRLTAVRRRRRRRLRPLRRRFGGDRRSAPAPAGSGPTVPTVWPLPEDATEPGRFGHSDALTRRESLAQGRRLS
ncbi:polysaccharide biosynthesis tyrosine autokinase [Brevibacterium casei]|nr:polysaccharide biosynthesis tyrosine autokinase [Brevibacterium casei]